MQHVTSPTQAHCPPRVQLRLVGDPTPDNPQSPARATLTVLGEQRRHEARQPGALLAVDKLETTNILESNPAERLFRQFWEGYNTRNLLPIIHSLCLPNVYMWGSAEDEDMEGLDAVVKQLKDDWHKSEKASIDVIRRIPSPPGALWAAALCNATFWIKNEKGILEEHVLKNYRCTVTAGKDKDGAWKIAHMHGSLPDPRTLENLATPEMRSKL